QMPFAVGQEAKTIEVTVSIGVSSVLTGADTVAGLVKRADVALYNAKNGGRNRVIVNLG
ncbi:MAG: diguanylate cyclase, partial [Mesorhizobium sp.]